jgi:ribosome-associated protein
MPAMRRPDETPSAADQSAERVSKTRRKAEMDALQALGKALVGVDPARLRELELPERLSEAIGDIRRMTRHEARRRQLQFIGRLMRDVDAEVIRAKVAAWSDAPNREKARLHAIERWRERLLGGDEALREFAATFPRANAAALEGLVARARRERAHGGPPRAYRELFRALTAALGDPSDHG